MVSLLYKSRFAIIVIYEKCLVSVSSMYKITSQPICIYVYTYIYAFYTISVVYYDFDLFHHNNLLTISILSSFQSTEAYRLNV